jgi:F-type H+-transporting ATPase subunit a
MTFASGFSWFRLIPAVDRDSALHALGVTEHSLSPGHEVANTTVYLHAWLAAAVLIAFAIVARIGLEKARSRNGLERYFTSDKITPLAFAEVFVGGIYGIMADLLDKKDAKLFFPLIGGLFLYIFACNIQSIIPGFLPPTDNINTNVGMALITFLTFNFVGLSRDPVGYIKHLAGPVLLLAPFMFPLEVLSLCIRPMSLTIRLTANLFGDHLVFNVMSDLVPPVVPALLLVLACVVSVIQAFVFSLLTVIYIHLALPHHEGHDDHAHAH